MVADSWGRTTYSYDSAWRLHTVKYPTAMGSTITETDGYDADGNRLAISSTGGVSGTVLVTNTYTYDANGNQVIASGPTSAMVNTYNQQNQLIQWSCQTRRMTHGRWSSPCEPNHSPSQHCHGPLACAVLRLSSCAASRVRATPVATPLTNSLSLFCRSFTLGRYHQKGSIL